MFFLTYDVGVFLISPVLFAVCEGYMLGTVSSFYETDAVIMAAGITAAVTLGLTLFAFQTKWDFTACGGRLLVPPD